MKSGAKYFMKILVDFFFTIKFVKSKLFNKNNRTLTIILRFLLVLFFLMAEGRYLSVWGGGVKQKRSHFPISSQQTKYNSRKIVFTMKWENESVAKPRNRFEGWNGEIILKTLKRTTGSHKHFFRPMIEGGGEVAQYIVNQRKFL